jgi:CubicO group peptidase (beta-lactamase class C family)/D-alanyl-D-alanine dipeptidase
VNRTCSRSVLLAGLLATACAPAQDSPRDRIDATGQYAPVAAALETRILREIDDKHLRAVTIALVDDQQIVWAQGFGIADPADSTPATARTIQRIGSVSKLFTDIGIMQLVEKGELDLDAPITTYLPGFDPVNPYDRPITMRELMSHRSGLMREPPVGNYFDPTGSTLAAMVASLNGRDIVYEPGTHTKYSNAGIGVVGYVLEHTQNQAFAQYLEHSVLDRMGLENSAFEPLPRFDSLRARGVMWTPDGREFEAPTFELGMIPAGSMYASVLDLGRFMSVLFAGGRGPDGPVISTATLDTMWTPQYAAPGQTNGYGLGFALSQLDGHRRVSHGGAIYGFATELSALPDDRVGAVVVVTLDVANTVSSRIAEDALRLMLAARSGAPLPSIRTPVPVDTTRIASLVGRYALLRNTDSSTIRRDSVRGGEGVAWIDLVRRGDQLMYVDDGRYALRAFGDTLVVDDRRAYGVRIVQLDSGRILVGADTMVRVAAAKPRPPAERFTGLIGEYGRDHDVLYIHEKGGRLWALIEWFFDYPLDEIGRDVYRFPTRGLYDGEDLVFTRGPNGRATQVVAAGVLFPRREVGTEAGVTFRITPQLPVDSLRRLALAASPPPETGNFLATELVELRTLDPSIRYDIRYASTNNFMGEQFYTEPHAFMQRPAAEAVARASRALRPYGYGLLIHDAYRPWYVTKMFWDATPDSLREFVADPASGSRHNRGAAVDLTMYDLATGKPVPMVSGYDEFSPRAYPDYPGGSALEQWHRELLRRTMEAEGFNVYEWEWWHFDFHDWRRYRIGNTTFENLR